MRRSLAFLSAALALVGCEKKTEVRAPVSVKTEQKVEPQNVTSVEAPATAAPKANVGERDHGQELSGPVLMGTSGLAVGMGGLGLRGAGSGGGGLGGVVGRLGLKGVGAGGADRFGDTEDYGHTEVNAWTLTSRDHLSTFSVDVDTASYTLARAKLMSGQLPPSDSVRVEEWLNYFRYRYPQPEKGVPLSVTMDAAPSPFTPNRHLLRVGVQGRAVDFAERTPAHLTFLVDASGSMQSPERLPLAKRALRLLVDQLHDGDTVSLVTYAGSVRLVLPHTGMNEKARIHAAIEALSAGGSTAMSSGLDLAYEQAVKVLDSKSSSRVIILSDGDANVGAATHEALLAQISRHVKEGVTVTTVGFGMGNYKSVLMEQFADRGNGNHFYVDSLLAARRVFVEQLGGTLEVIAQDVKLQVDFDPNQVNAYRLIGYENRDLADQDFRNDRVDAGEVGAGHTVTALYELDLKAGAGAGLATVRLRAKAPRGVSAGEKAFVFPASAIATRFDAAPADLRFATAVMGAAEIFRRSPHAAEWDYELVRRIAAGATQPGDAEREEFLSLLERARALGHRVASR